MGWMTEAAKEGRLMAKERPVSPVNGQPVPVGRTWKTSEEASEAGKKGGKKSAEVRRARKTLREELLILLSAKDDGSSESVQTSMSSALIKSALEGNVRAFEVIRDTIGEKPVDNISVSTPDMTALDEAFSKVDSTP